MRSALSLARRRLDADVIVVGMGPGSVGTGSFLGFSGIEVAGLLDTAGDAGGKPIAALRVSDADERLRHRGVSMHSRTVLLSTHVPVTVPIPAGTTDLPPLENFTTVVEVEVPDAVGYLSDRGIQPTTMGRTPDDDPRAFSFAAAAGAYAQSLCP